MKKFLLYLLEIVIILLIYVIVTGTLWYFTHLPKNSEWLFVYIIAITSPSFILSEIFDKWYKRKILKKDEISGYL